MIINNFSNVNCVFLHGMEKIDQQIFPQLGISQNNSQNKNEKIKTVEDMLNKFNEFIKNNLSDNDLIEIQISQKNLNLSAKAVMIINTYLEYFYKIFDTGKDVLNIKSLYILFIIHSIFRYRPLNDENFDENKAFEENAFKFDKLDFLKNKEFDKICEELGGASKHKEIHIFYKKLISYLSTQLPTEVINNFQLMTGITASKNIKKNKTEDFFYSFVICDTCGSKLIKIMFFLMDILPKLKKIYNENPKMNKDILKNKLTNFIFHMLFYPLKYKYIDSMVKTYIEYVLHESNDHFLTKFSKDKGLIFQIYESGVKLEFSKSSNDLIIYNYPDPLFNVVINNFNSTTHAFNADPKQKIKFQMLFDNQDLHLKQQWLFFSQMTTLANNPKIKKIFLNISDESIKNIKDTNGLKGLLPLIITTFKEVKDLEIAIDVDAKIWQYISDSLLEQFRSLDSNLSNNTNCYDKSCMAVAFILVLSKLFTEFLSYDAILEYAKKFKSDLNKKTSLSILKYTIAKSLDYKDESVVNNKSLVYDNIMQFSEIFITIGLDNLIKTVLTNVLINKNIHIICQFLLISPYIYTGKASHLLLSHCVDLYYSNNSQLVKANVNEKIQGTSFFIFFKFVHNQEYTIALNLDLGKFFLAYHDINDYSNISLKSLEEINDNELKKKFMEEIEKIEKNTVSEDKLKKMGIEVMKIFFDGDVFKFDKIQNILLEKLLTIYNRNFTLIDFQSPNDFIGNTFKNIELNYQEEYNKKHATILNKESFTNHIEEKIINNK